MSNLVKTTVQNNKQLIAWDSISDCNPSTCPIGEDCPYKQSNSLVNKCGVQKEYLDSFVEMVFSTYRCMTEDDMFKVGMHLVPLYAHLCRQKIVERGLAKVCYLDSKGNHKVHPIYREIRDTMKTITLMWRDLGIQRAMNPDLPSGGDGKSGYGDPNHYREISKVVDRRNVR